MKKLLLAVTALLSVSLTPVAQDRGTAPVNWARYKMSESNFSLMFPKLPLREDQEDVCREHKSSLYFSYAQGVVYEFGVYTKWRGMGRYMCEGRAMKFEKAIRDRVAKLREEKETPAESVVQVEGRAAAVFTNSISTRWMIAYPDRWIEIAVHHYANEKPDMDRFFKSLEWSATSGQEIGAGSGVVLGDPNRATKTDPAPTDMKADLAPAVNQHAGSGFGDGKSVSPVAALDSDPYRTLSQPRARYTDAARKEDVQGAVRLKITLLANGRVGSIVPITTLPHGLTEMSIAAARRMVFLPKRVNKIPVSIVVTREYTFTIY